MAWQIDNTEWLWLYHVKITNRPSFKCLTWTKLLLNSESEMFQLEVFTSSLISSIVILVNEHFSNYGI